MIELTADYSTVAVVVAVGTLALIATLVRVLGADAVEAAAGEAAQVGLV